MAQQATQLILLADHSKLGLTSRMNYAAIKDITALITDSGAASLAAFAALEKALPEVVLA
jgi:DeoR/GlpR family transcriptional regulator of sugar metabolism